MASIRKRKGSRGITYQVLYRDRAGMQRSESFNRRKAAEDRKSEVEVEIRTGSFISPREARVSFGHWYRHWEPTRHLSATRKATDDSRRDRYVLPRWGRVPLDAISYLDAQAWVAQLGKTMGPASIRACFRLLKLPLDAAVLDGKIRTNPVIGVKLPPVPQSTKTADDVLTADELMAVVSSTDDRWQALVFVCGWLGLRWSEALGLRRCDVNPMRGELHVGRLTVVEPGGAGLLLVKEGAKTAGSVRTIPLPEMAQAVLLDHMARFVSDQSPEAFLFLTEEGLHPRRCNFRRTFQRALRNSGVDKTIPVHALRHTAATLMLDASLDLLDVSKRLGHSRPSTTLDLYAHLLNARRDAGTIAIEAAMKASALD
jgi:integrase